VLRTFAEISGLNIVIDPTIQGTVDVSLRDVPWDQALDIILRANKLGYVVDGTIVRVAPLRGARRRGAQRRKLRRAGAVRRAARADAFAQLRAGRGPAAAADGDGAVVARLDPDRRAHEHAHHQRPARSAAARHRSADDARLAAAAGRNRGAHRPDDAPVRADDRRAVGLSGRASNSIGNTTGLAFPNQGSLTGRPAARRARRRRAAVRRGGDGGEPRRAPAQTALGLALGSINGALNLDVILSALERQGQGRLLSTPRVTTQNNVEAEMTQGVQIPIQTVANNTVTVTFKDAALTLKVTPQITAANTVIMRVSLENASPDFSKSVNNIPPIDTQRAITQVLVNNGDTTVIGGIYVSSEQTNKDGTPACHAAAARLAVQARRRERRKPRAADLHHAAHSDAVGEEP
jgi:type IV pilus assembly protein PilQ